MGVIERGVRLFHALSTTADVYKEPRLTHIYLVFHHCIYHIYKQYTGTWTVLMGLLVLKCNVQHLYLMGSGISFCFTLSIPTSLYFTLFLPSSLSASISLSSSIVLR